MQEKEKENTEKKEWNTKACTANNLTPLAGPGTTDNNLDGHD
jgi:hypothetical protein